MDASSHFPPFPPGTEQSRRALQSLLLYCSALFGCWIKGWLEWNKKGRGRPTWNLWVVECTDKLYIMNTITVRVVAWPGNSPQFDSLPLISLLIPRFALLLLSRPSWRQTSGARRTAWRSWAGRRIWWQSTRARRECWTIAISRVGR